MDKSKIDLLDDRSEITREVIGKMPSWIIRRGLGTFFIFICLFITSLYIIQYPDTIEAPVTITSTNPSVSIIAEANGEIKLLVANKQLVLANGIIAVIQSTAKMEHVLSTKTYVQEFRKSIMANQVKPGLIWPDTLNLGPVQYDYVELIKLYNEYLDNRRVNLLSKVIALTHERLNKYYNLKQSVEHLEELEQRRSNIAERIHERNTGLFKEKVIAPVQFEESEALYLNALELTEEKKTELASVEIKIKELEGFIAEKKSEIIQYDKDLINRMMSLTFKIESTIALWEHDYILRNPVEGTVHFLNFWTSHLYVNKGDQVCIVTPNNTDSIFAKLQVTPIYAGKIKPGQNVRIKLKNYPFQEFGMIVGRIESISLVANKNNTYFIDVVLPKKLMTTYKISIPYQPDLTGTAEIELQSMSFLERIFYHFRSHVNRSV